MEQIRFLEWHMAGQPGRGSDIQMRLVIPHSTRADGGRVDIRRTDDNLNFFLQSPFTGDLRAKCAENRVRWSKLGQLCALNGGKFNELIIIFDVLDVTIIRQ